MPKTTTLPSSPDNFWSRPSLGYGSPAALARGNSRESAVASMDESPDFYDPYSDLNLFLSQKLKQEIHPTEGAQKWSLKLQEELIRKIAPEFQKKFPHYRLGIAALKKVWEKISYYSQQLQHQQGATTREGTLNIPFFIRENLKNFIQNKTSSALQPFHYAHQIAMKMCECLATVDGIRPKIGEITKLIWVIQRHLIPGGRPETHKSPYDEYDKTDRIIVRTLLEISAKDPHLSCEELEAAAIETLQELQPDIERKIHLWAVQGDMMCRWIHLDADTPLLQSIVQKIKTHLDNNLEIDHEQLIQQLSNSTDPLNHRIPILYKYAWYTLLCNQHESSYDRFIKWHACSIKTINGLKEVVQSKLPLIPFDETYVERQVTEH